MSFRLKPRCLLGGFKIGLGLTVLLLSASGASLPLTGAQSETLAAGAGRPQFLGLNHHYCLQLQRCCSDSAVYC